MYNHSAACVQINSHISRSSFNQKPLFLCIHVQKHTDRSHVLRVIVHDLLVLIMEVAGSRILTGVRFLIVEVLDEAVVSSRERTAKQRANPVNPMIAGKRCTGDCRSEAACGVK